MREDVQKFIGLEVIPFIIIAIIVGCFMIGIGTMISLLIQRCT